MESEMGGWDGLERHCLLVWRVSPACLTSFCLCRHLCGAALWRPFCALSSVLVCNGLIDSTLRKVRRVERVRGRQIGTQQENNNLRASTHERNSTDGKGMWGQWVRRPSRASWREGLGLGQEISFAPSFVLRASRCQVQSPSSCTLISPRWQGKCGVEGSLPTGH